MSRKKILITLYAVCIIIFASCSNNKERDLVFAAIPSDDMLQTTRYTQEFSTYLSKVLNRKVKHFTATDYTVVIEAMRSGKCDICILGPYSYVLAHEKAGAEAIAVAGFPSGEQHSYRCLLFVNPHLKIKQATDIVTLSKNLSMCFSEPTSTSGHLIPRHFLSTIGIQAESDFKKVSFSGSHAATILSVSNGHTDIGAASSESVSRLMANKAIDSSKINIIWTSEKLYTDPICVSNKLPIELKNSIQKAILEMHKNDTAIFNNYIRYTYRGNSYRDSIRFVAAHDSMYDGLREIARMNETLKKK